MKAPGRAYDPLITVCNACLQASCWQGEFYCDDYLSAGLEDRAVSNLCNGGHPREHPDYWNAELRAKHLPELTLSDLRAHGLDMENWDSSVE